MQANPQKPLFWIVLLGCSLAPVLALAATRTWDGGGTDSNWSTCNNWSANSCPGTTDIARFDSTSSTSATISSNVSVRTVNITSGYTGTITQGSGNTLTVGTGGFTVSGGTFAGGNATIDVNGAFTLSGGAFTATSGSLTISGNFTLSSGSFTHNSGSVTLDGNSQTISGSVTFNNLTKSVTTARTLTFGAGQTVTIAGTATLNGASGARLSLRSSTAGTQTSIDPQGTRSFSYLNIRDNYNVNASEAGCVTSCVDAGNNTGWRFTREIGFTATSSSGAEGTTPLNLGVTLSDSHTSDVTVQYAVSGGTATGSGTDYTLASGTATVTAGNTTTTIPVTIVNDTLDEDDETIIVTLSSPSGASLGDNTTHTTTITDDDTAPTATFSTASQSVSEAVGGVTATVNLSAASSLTVTVPYSVSGTASATSDHDLSSGSLTISAGATSGTISFNVTDDSSDESDETIITTMGTPTNATAGATTVHTVTITDNDTAGVTVTPSGGSTSVTEGSGTGDTYTVVLNSQPSADVTVTLSSGDDVDLSTGALTFTSSNYSVAQTITVTAADDDIAEGTHADTVTHAVTSSDTGYNGLTADAVAVSISDDDTASVSLTESSGATTATEGGATDTYTIVLTSEPTADVMITLAASSQLSVSPASVTFTSANWDTAQTVTVSATNDDVAEGSHSGTIAHSATSSDSGYSGISIAAITAGITDNDNAGVSVTESASATQVTEGGTTDTYTVVLTSEPNADVTITPSAETDLTVSPASLTFTAANWNAAQTITVSATDDDVAEGSENATITHTATSSDASYQGITVNPVTAAITDDDTAGVSLATSGGDTQVSEGDASDSYTVVLTSEPLSDVTITLANDDEVTLSSGLLTFTSANWDSPQTITVTAVDDDAVEGNHASTVTHVADSSDTSYAGLTIADLTVTISDDDAAGVTISASGGTTVVSESGTTDTYTVVLTSQPAATVTFSITTDTQLSATPTSLTFTASDWASPQTVTLTAVDDATVEGDHAATVTHALTSSDSNYKGLAAAAITVNITDNDTAAAEEAESEEEETDTGEGSAAGTNTGTEASGDEGENATESEEGEADETTTDETGTEATDDGSNDNDEGLAISAGGDFQAPGGTEVTLAGEISAGDTENATVLWTQISGSAVALVNASSLAASFIAPAFGDEDLVFRLSVTAGGVTLTDEVTVTLMRETLAADSPLAETLEGRLMAAEDGTVVIATEASDDDGPYLVIDFDDSLIVHTSQDAFINVLLAGDHVIISDPLYQDGRGIIVAIDRNATTRMPIDLDADDLATQDGVTVRPGEGDADLLGFGLLLGDIDGDGVSEILAQAPGTATGTVYVLSVETLAVESVITGSEDENLKSTQMLLGDINGGSGSEIILGLRLSASAGLLVSDLDTADFGISSDSASFNGLNGGAFIDVDFGEAAPDFIMDNASDISHGAVGDVNGDGIDDLVVASQDACTLWVYTGDEDIGTVVEEISAVDTMTCVGDTTFESLAVDDVSGDGIDDVLIGFPEAVGGAGRVYVVFGRPEWEGWDIQMDDALVVAGDDERAIGGWLLAGDADGDGRWDLLTGQGDDETVMFPIERMMALSEDEEDAPTGAALLGPGGTSGCSLNANTEMIANAGGAAAQVFTLLCVIAATVTMVWGRRRSQDK